eukprot:GHVT01048278.1.p1 GENE.GHVT01048278.1~~GHVT01048278.1.p1  ORF type:complete len:741 (+),score=115.49 GHVT01048278.1:6869-9091(+)
MSGSSRIIKFELLAALLPVLSSALKPIAACMLAGLNTNQRTEAVVSGVPSESLFPTVNYDFIDAYSPSLKEPWQAYSSIPYSPPAHSPSMYSPSTRLFPSNAPQGNQYAANNGNTLLELPADRVNELISLLKNAQEVARDQLAENLADEPESEPEIADTPAKVDEAVTVPENTAETKPKDKDLENNAESTKEPASPSPVVNEDEEEVNHESPSALPFSASELLKLMKEALASTISGPLTTETTVPPAPLSTTTNTVPPAPLATTLSAPPSTPSPSVTVMIPTPDQLPPQIQDYMKRYFAQEQIQDPFAPLDTPLTFQVNGVPNSDESLQQSMQKYLNDIQLAHEQAHYALQLQLSGQPQLLLEQTQQTQPPNPLQQLLPPELARGPAMPTQVEAQPELQQPQIPTSEQLMQQSKQKLVEIPAQEQPVQQSQQDQQLQEFQRLQAELAKYHQAEQIAKEMAQKQAQEQAQEQAQQQPQQQAQKRARQQNQQQAQLMAQQHAQLMAQQQAQEQAQQQAQQQAQLLAQQHAQQRDFLVAQQKAQQKALHQSYQTAQQQRLPIEEKPVQQQPQVPSINLVLSGPSAAKIFESPELEEVMKYLLPLPQGVPKAPSVSHDSLPSESAVRRPDAVTASPQPAPFTTVSGVLPSHSPITEATALSQRRPRGRPAQVKRSFRTSSPTYATASKSFISTGIPFDLASARQLPQHPDASTNYIAIPGRLFMPRDAQAGNLRMNRNLRATVN